MKYSIIASKLIYMELHSCCFGNSVSTMIDRNQLTHVRLLHINIDVFVLFSRVMAGTQGAVGLVLGAGNVSSIPPGSGIGRS